MSDDDTVISFDTPTKSEFATFQVLANKEFVDLNKPLPDHTIINVREEKVEAKTPEPPKKLPEINVEDEYYDDDEEYEDDYPEAAPKQAPSQAKQVFEVPKSKYAENAQLEIEAEKEALLSELLQMEKDGLYKPVKPLTMKDPLEEIQFQYDRIQSEMNSNQIVDMAKSAIKMGSGVVEMTLKNAGIKVVDGFHNNLCKDMNKFNRPLGRLYKKYWRRGGASPEMELAFIVFGSLAYTVVTNKMSGMSIFGSSATNAIPTPTDVPKPSEPFASAKPPQMPSLNVPSSFAADAKWKEMEVQQEKQKKEFLEKEEKLRKEMEEREKKMMTTIENMNNAFKVRENELYDQLDTLQKEKTDVRKVTLNVSATPKSRNKTKELNLDD